MTHSRPRPHRSNRSFRPLVVALLALGILVGDSSIASAGGWAVGSLDAVPVATAGERATVGFTILQHGVTPVDLLGDPSNEVGIEISGADGSAEFFPAVSEGTVGRYVATVEFPAAGTYEWSIRMGWFGPQPLGTLEVADASGATASGTPDSAWPTARLATLALTIGLAALAIADFLVTRRRARLAMP